MKKFYIAVVGSREFGNWKKLGGTEAEAKAEAEEHYILLKGILDDYIDAEHMSKFSEGVIVSGGALGADLMGERYAEERDMQTIIHLPDWPRYGRGAGMVRNKLIIDDAEYVFAFHNGSSKGTMNSIGHAKKANKPYEVLGYNVKKYKEK